MLDAKIFFSIFVHAMGKKTIGCFLAHIEIPLTCRIADALQIRDSEDHLPKKIKDSGLIADSEVKLGKKNNRPRGKK